MGQRFIIDCCAPAGKVWGRGKVHPSLKNKLELALWQRYRWSSQPPAASINCTLANPSLCPRRARSEMYFLVIWWCREDAQCLLTIYKWILGSIHNLKNYCFLLFILNICMSPVLRKINNEKFINLNRFSNRNSNKASSVWRRDKTTTAQCLRMGEIICISGSILGFCKWLCCPNQHWCDWIKVTLSLGQSLVLF